MLQKYIQWAIKEASLYTSAVGSCTLWIQVVLIDW